MNNGCTIWMTGLSGAGKSTIADALHEVLISENKPVEILDGDVVRTHLSKGLGFSREDRDTNIERIGFVAGLLSKHGAIVICAAISPYKETREKARTMSKNFLEVFVDAPLDVVAKRDVKGLYKKAFAGEIKEFTGVSDPYEAPDNPELHLRTDQISVQDGVERILSEVRDRRWI